MLSPIKKFVFLQFTSSIPSSVTYNNVYFAARYNRLEYYKKPEKKTHGRGKNSTEIRSVPVLQFNGQLIGRDATGWAYGSTKHQRCLATQGLTDNTFYYFWFSSLTLVVSARFVEDFTDCTKFLKILDGPWSIFHHSLFWRRKVSALMWGTHRFITVWTLDHRPLRSRRGNFHITAIFLITFTNNSAFFRSTFFNLDL